jgi:hypothetical protein
VQKIPDYLNPLVSILSTYIEHKVDHFTLQTYGGQYVDGPYVQALQEHDNVLLIESVSNEYLNPQLDEAGQQTHLTDAQIIFKIKWISSSFSLKALVLNSLHNCLSSTVGDLITNTKHNKSKSIIMNYDSL